MPKDLVAVRKEFGGLIITIKPHTGIFDVLKGFFAS